MHARSIALSAALALSVVRCEAPTPSLSGTWVPAYKDQGGGWEEFTLNDAGGAITGKVLFRYLSGSGPQDDSSLVMGTRAGTSVRLQFTDYGTPATITGRLATVALDPRADTLFIATWVVGSDTSTGPFYPLVRGQ